MKTETKIKRHAENSKILHEYIEANAGARPKRIAADLKWTTSKLNIVYAQNKDLFFSGLVCKSSVVKPVIEQRTTP